MTISLNQFPDYFSTSEVFSRPLRAKINIASFKQNIKNVEKHVGSSELIVVLKADAYGHGLVELAGVSAEYDLAVAIPEELITLRRAGIENRVWVLEGCFSTKCLKYENVVWVIHSFWQLDLIKEAFLNGQIQSLDICIKLDTGMHRLGFDRSDLFMVKQIINTIPQVNIYGLLTHFSMSDQHDNNHVNAQISRFDEMLKDQSWESIGQSLSNSGAICFHPQAHREWVRPGIMLYGASPSPNLKLPVSISAVMSFESAIIALHKVKKGESVGYGKTWIAEVDSVIATVAVGYADGYPRHAPNGTPVAVISNVSEVCNIVCLVGRVSMDMITIDVTGLQDVVIGDNIELWGKRISVDKIAELSGTISYELLSGVSKRVPRIYINS